MVDVHPACSYQLGYVLVTGTKKGEIRRSFRDKEIYIKDFRHCDLHSSFAEDIALSKEFMIVDKAKFSEKGLNVFRYTAVMELSNADALALV